MQKTGWQADRTQEAFTSCCCAAAGVATAYFANGQVASNVPPAPPANSALLNEASYMFGVHVVRSPLLLQPSWEHLRGMPVLCSCDARCAHACSSTSVCSS